MSVDDFRINATVRQVLSRAWVDLDRLRYGAVSRIVYFHGHFSRQRVPEGPPEAADDDDPGPREQDLLLLEDVERTIRRDPLVADVIFRLENFRKVDGKWQVTGA